MIWGLPVPRTKPKRRDIKPGYWVIGGEIKKREDWVTDPRNVAGLGLGGIQSRMQRAKQAGRQMTIEDLMRPRFVYPGRGANQPRRRRD